VKPRKQFRHLTLSRRDIVTKALLAIGVVLFMGCAGEAQSAAPRAKTDRPRTVVLELFTSQGCSSCPPADELLSRLRRETFAGGTVIPLAYHVDYWNYLGWSDPFSSAQWSARQRDYAASIPSTQVYTPQLVINGTEQLVGSSERPVRAAIERQLDGRDRGSVSIERLTRTGNHLDVELRAHLDRDPAGGNADLVVVLFEDGLTTAVSRGENGGRSLTNDSIVRWQSRAAEVHADGVETTAKVTIPVGAGRLGVAAFLQDARSRAIFGSAARMVTNDTQRESRPSP
jgi:hypothetical protein